MPLADFRRILDVNAVGCWLGMKAVIAADDRGRRRLDRQHLLDRGLHRRGRAVRLQRQQVRDPRHDQGRRAGTRPVRDPGQLGSPRRRAHQHGAGGGRDQTTPATTTARDFLKSMPLRPVRRTGRDLAAGRVPGLRRARPTRPAASSSPTAASCPGPATDQMAFKPKDDMTDALALDGRAAIVTGAGQRARPRRGARAGRGRGPAGAQRPAGRRGAGGRRRDLARAGGQAAWSAGDIGEWADRPAARRGRPGRLRRPGHPGQQRRRAARPHGLLDVRPRNGTSCCGCTCAGHFVTTRFATALLARAEQAGRAAPPTAGSSTPPPRRSCSARPASRTTPRPRPASRR